MNLSDVKRETEKQSRRSAKLRRTLEIAQMCGFEYKGIGKYAYGGFFDAWQVEKIVETLRTLGASKGR